MYVNPVLLLSCLEKVAVFAETFELHTFPKENHRSIDKLVEIYNKYQSWPTTLVELPIQATDSALHGMFIKMEDGSMTVAIAEGLSYEWTRFVICKELMHGLLDEDGFRDMNIAEHIGSMQLSFPDNESRPPITVQVEFLAEVAAMEFLLPYSARKQAVASGLDLKDLAKAYGVPLKMVEVYCADSYMSHLNIEDVRARAAAHKD